MIPTNEYYLWLHESIGFDLIAFATVQLIIKSIENSFHTQLSGCLICLASFIGKFKRTIISILSEAENLNWHCFRERKNIYYLNYCEGSRFKLSHLLSVCQFEIWVLSAAWSAVPTCNTRSTASSPVNFTIISRNILTLRLGCFQQDHISVDTFCIAYSLRTLQYTKSNHHTQTRFIIRVFSRTHFRIIVESRYVIRKKQNN